MPETSSSTNRSLFLRMLATAIVASTALLASCDTVTTTVVFVAEVEVSPEVSVVAQGSEVQLTARPMSGTGEELAGAPVSWSSSAEKVATVDASGRVLGIAEGTVVIYARSGEAVDSARITVGQPPSIELSRGSLAIESVQRGDPVSRNVDISNGGTIPLEGLSARVSYDGASGWLTASLNGTTAPTSLVVRADPATLSPGLHRATVFIDAPLATNSPARVDVAFEVIRLPEIDLDRGVVNLNAANPSEDVGITNGAPGVLNGLSVSVSYAGVGGWLSASLTRTTAPASVTLSAGQPGLPAGTYSATVTVRSSIAGVDPVTMPVTAVLPNLAITTPDKQEADERSSSRIDLKWRDRSNNETRFEVQRGTLGSTWQLIATLNSGSEQYTDNGLASNQTYAYRIRACHPWACSVWSKTTWAKTKR